MRKDARHLDDVWKATLDHSLEARDSVEDVYRADLRGAFQKKDDAEARELVYKRLAAGAGFLRDLAYTAWIESAKPVPRGRCDQSAGEPGEPEIQPGGRFRTRSVSASEIRRFTNERSVLIFLITAWPVAGPGYRARVPEWESSFGGCA